MEDIIIYREKPVEHLVSYDRLLKRLRKRRITLGSFAKKAGITREDLYNMRIGVFMSFESEARACVFLECDLKDIREVFVPDDWNERLRAECIKRGVDPDNRPSTDHLVFTRFV